MDIKITPQKLSGSIKATPSKSYAHRLFLAAALADKPTLIYCPSLSKDTEATLCAITALGAKAEQINGKQIKITPIKNRQIAKADIFCGESGTTARLILPIAASLCQKATVSGQGSLLSRPLAALCKALENNGCSFNAHTLPITLTGTLNPGNYQIIGNESSQYISGLLLALPLLTDSSRITLTTPLESVGYVDITLDVLKQFDAKIEGMYDIPGNQIYRSPGKATVEGDWSNAAFWLAAGVKVSGLDSLSCQKDRFFEQIKDQSDIDAIDVPDLVPILAVYAASKHTVTRINNIGRLRLKESNRIETVGNMLKALGTKIKTDQNEIIIYGQGFLSGGVVNGSNDHRIVMAAAIASTFCNKPVIITGTQAVDKSYPSFFKDFQMLGGKFDVL
ncbi:MAG: 3-phosphoshikimate 1-carboxyvinyltransferase [Chloroflexi bacterium]|nr:3-phosphoshikimate 1-carboxyvinyltransferase [Chloroflexota bacterium]